MIKGDLRKIYLQKRLSLSEAEYAELSFQLCQTFFHTIDLSFVNTLHTFLPLKKNKEPDTWGIISRIRSEFPHIRIAVPRVNNDAGRLESFIFEELEQLQLNSWGIPEPVRGEHVPHTDIDIVLVPLLILDNKGHRVGYGKGFYDKLLVECSPSCRRIGLSFFHPVDEITDANVHDQLLNTAVTPTGRLDF